jgi:hypothetical protein
MRENTTLACTLATELLLFMSLDLKSGCLLLQIVGINPDDGG